MHYPEFYLSSNQSANRYCNIFFADHTYVLADQILSISPSRQAGLFVLQSISAQLMAQTRSWQSPYFDYSAANVRVMIGQLKDALSTNIRLERAFLEPLLANGIYQTWHLLHDPIGFMADYWSSLASENQTFDYLQSQIRFYHFYKIPLTLTAQQLYDTQSVFCTENIISCFKTNIEALPNRPSASEFVTMLGWQVREIPTSAPDLSITNPNIQFELKLGNPDTVLVSNSQTSDVVINPDAVLDMNINSDNLASNSSAPVHIPVSQLHQSLHSPTATALHQNLKNNSQNLHESIAGALPYLANQEAIHFSIYEKFLYINELFGGDSRSFYQAIQTLETQANKPQALKQLQQSYGEKFDWAARLQYSEPFLAILQKYVGQ